MASEHVASVAEGHRQSLETTAVLVRRSRSRWRSPAGSATRNGGVLSALRRALSTVLGLYEAEWAWLQGEDDDPFGGADATTVQAWFDSF